MVQIKIPADEREMTSLGIYPHWAFPTPSWAGLVDLAEEMGAFLARLRGGGGAREEEHRPSRVTDQDRAVLVSSERGRAPL